MQVFVHNLWEFRKGLRSLAMHTLLPEQLDEAIHLLREAGVDYHVATAIDRQVVVVFGSAERVEAIRRLFGEDGSDALKPCGSFVLGALLGYSPDLLVRRFLLDTSPSMHDEVESEVDDVAWEPGNEAEVPYESVFG